LLLTIGGARMSVADNNKTCKKCAKQKIIDDFFISKTKKGIKIKAQCKECFKEIERKRYYEKNKDKIEERKKKPIVSRREYNKKYYQENRARIIKQTKQYAADNKEQVLRTHSEYYRKNKKSILKKLKNKQPQINQYIREKRKNNINIKISHNLRVRIRCAIKKNMKWKKSKYVLGCDIETFKKHLESKFRDGMTWENYGSFWHIDHIRPCSSFDLSIVEEQQKCFHYTNLQPLTAEENHRKSDKIPKEENKQ